MANPDDPNFYVFVNGILNTLFASVIDLEEEEIENIVLHHIIDGKLGIQLQLYQRLVLEIPIATFSFFVLNNFR